ncbi:hypothetical protein T03_16828 [Trichinella britovi]|uniref:Uncharacterized protein n=1 Tax=Trichinella britovi TaxID=45882 RepID=A0A0V1D2W3_TRIBR|nr:hypothetical protein T03_16828 [Trichinella britovi]
MSIVCLSAKLAFKFHGHCYCPEILWILMLLVLSTGYLFHHSYFLNHLIQSLLIFDCLDRYRFCFGTICLNRCFSSRLQASPLLRHLVVLPLPDSFSNKRASELTAAIRLQYGRGPNQEKDVKEVVSHLFTALRRQWAQEAKFTKMVNISDYIVELAIGHDYDPLQKMCLLPGSEEDRTQFYRTLPEKIGQDTQSAIPLCVEEVASCRGSCFNPLRRCPSQIKEEKSRLSSGKVVVRLYFPVVGIQDISDHNTNDKYDSHWCHCSIIVGDICICVLFDSSGSLPLIDMNLLPLQPSQELPSS